MGGPWRPWSPRPMMLEMRKGREQGFERDRSAGAGWGSPRPPPNAEPSRLAAAGGTTVAVILISVMILAYLNPPKRI